MNYPDDFKPSTAVVVEDKVIQTMVRAFKPNVGFTATGNVLIRNGGSHLEIYRLESTVEMPEGFANKYQDWMDKNEVAACHVEALSAAIKFLGDAAGGEA